MNDDLRAKAAAQLAALPPDGIWWHGKNGKPCPCASCCQKVLDAMEPEPEGEKRGKRR